jgi:hypothetical protein
MRQKASWEHYREATTGGGSYKKETYDLLTEVQYQATFRQLRPSKKWCFGSPYFSVVPIMSELCIDGIVTSFSSLPSNNIVGSKRQSVK